VDIPYPIQVDTRCKSMQREKPPDSAKSPEGPVSPTCFPTNILSQNPILPHMHFAYT
jgi:hypothetical protein